MQENSLSQDNHNRKFGSQLHYLDNNFAQVRLRRPGKEVFMQSDDIFDIFWELIGTFFSVYSVILSPEVFLEDSSGLNLAQLFYNYMQGYFQTPVGEPLRLSLRDLFIKLSPLLVKKMPFLEESGIDLQKLIKDEEYIHSDEFRGSILKIISRLSQLFRIKQDSNVGRALHNIITDIAEKKNVTKTHIDTLFKAVLNVVCSPFQEIILKGMRTVEEKSSNNIFSKIVAQAFKLFWQALKTSRYEDFIHLGQKFLLEVLKEYEQNQAPNVAANQENFQGHEEVSVQDNNIGVNFCDLLGGTETN